MLNNLLGAIKWIVYGIISIRLFVSGRKAERLKSYEQQEHGRIHARKIHDSVVSPDSAKRLRDKYRK